MNFNKNQSLLSSNMRVQTSPSFFQVILMLHLKKLSQLVLGEMRSYSKRYLQQVIANSYAADNILQKH